MPRLAAAGVEIIAQPSANPWPWNERWVFCASGEDQLRREQWLREGLFAQLPAMPGVRYAVNPQLIGDLLGTRFDGRSYVFGRDADGTARVIAAAAARDARPRKRGDPGGARAGAVRGRGGAGYVAASRSEVTPLPLDAAATPRLPSAARTS